MEQEMGEPNPNQIMRMRKRRKKMTLEDYILITQNPNQVDLTVDYLNQIISMHGFKMIHKTQKKVLVDAMSSIDLMDPCRSTIKDENISSCAFINLEEVIKDLTDLNWQECCITSLQTLNSVAYDLSHHNATASTSKSKPKRSQKKVRRLGSVCGYSTTTTTAGDGCGPCDVVGGSQSVCSSAVDGEWDAKKCAPKRRSKKRYVYGGFGAAVGEFSSSSSMVITGQIV